MHFGSASAFLCITKHGAMPSMPKFETVDNFIKKYFPWNRNYKNNYNIEYNVRRNLYRDFKG